MNALGFRRRFGVVLAIAAMSGEADAQEVSVDAIRAEIEAIRDDRDVRITAIRTDTDARLHALERRLSQLDGGEGAPIGPSAPATVTPPGAFAAAAPTVAGPRLNLSGDVRLRFEQNWQPGRDRGRGVVRARLKATYVATGNVSLGARIATGDPDDPNTADVTLSNFDDDLQVSLDQLYARGNFGAATVVGGKFDNPFVRTDLVWDGDVNPQGAAVRYDIGSGNSASVSATGLYFLIDEASTAQDSSMLGGQVAGAFGGSGWKAELAVGYYDYRLHSLSGADTGDFRSNLLDAQGRYLSDFNLLDIVGTVSFDALGRRWPVRLVGDYVRNFGAKAGSASGLGGDIFLGRASARGDWRFQYGYAEAGIDAVLAAFSHDNLDLATNYREHILGVDYVPLEGFVLNGIFYRYRAKDGRFLPPGASSDWRNRLRLSLIYAF